MPEIIILINLQMATFLNIWLKNIIYLYII